MNVVFLFQNSAQDAVRGLFDPILELRDHLLHLLFSSISGSRRPQLLPREFVAVEPLGFAHEVLLVPLRTGRSKSTEPFVEKKHSFQVSGWLVEGGEEFGASLSTSYSLICFVFFFKFLARL